MAGIGEERQSGCGQGVTLPASSVSSLGPQDRRSTIPDLTTDPALVAALLQSAQHPSPPHHPEDRPTAYLYAWVQEALAEDRPRLTMQIVKSLNGYAFALGRHNNRSAGRLRACGMFTANRGPCGGVIVRRRAPGRLALPHLMSVIIDDMDRAWGKVDPVALATFALWGINYSHPFEDGNGRTARAASYLVLCLALGGWLPGSTILPALLVRERDEYVEAICEAHRRLPDGTHDLSRLHSMVCRLLREQIEFFPQPIFG